MKIALLGYGKEGKAAEKYFKEKFNADFEIFENFTREEIEKKDFSGFDLVLRSPSVPPLHLKNESSLTRYFFDHCPCPIIGVTATKGKGTTCSFIKSLLDAMGEDAFIVGNIGTPAIESLDSLKETSVVVYEMSSFQLWDLEKSPHVAVVGTIEPDHLNVHNGFDDYINAKANICRHQSTDDYLVYYSKNNDTKRIADNSKAKKLTYPFDLPKDVEKAIVIPGEHNKMNAMAAITAVACYKNISPDEYLSTYKTEIINGLKNFKGLPHRLEYVRELNGVKYYDDNFSTNPASTRVAIDAFPNNSVIAIIGGRDKTENVDLPEIYEVISAKNVKKVVLMGESGHEIFSRWQDDRFILVESLEEAVNTAKSEAEKLASAIVLMSPSAASFDMFENVYDRGAKYQALIKSLS